MDSENNNITFRKNKRTISLNETITESLDTTMFSLANTSLGGANTCCEELQGQIKALTSKLLSAHTDIDDMRSEIKELKDELKKCSEFITNLKSSAVTEKHTKASSSKKKGESNNKNQKKEIRDMKENIANENIPQRSPVMNEEAIYSYRKNIKVTPKPITNKQNNKICIISSNNCNSILYTAREKLPDFEICHYIKPHCGVRQLLEQLKQKLINYTMKDFCIVLIGEDDFNTTGNNVDMIYDIRNTLKDILTTNIILCLPNFKLNNWSNMFNSRIENFNNLLYLDVMTHLYTYILDSNLNLSYDSVMFDQRTGRINNNGISTIFEDLKLIIEEISTTPDLNCVDINNVTPTDPAGADTHDNHNVPTTSKLFLV